MTLDRGTVVLVELDPTIGHEQRGVRPCIAVSDPSVNADQRFPLIAVVPVTGTPGVGALYPALLPGPLFVILLSGVHERAALDRKPFGQAAVAFGAMAATILTAVYFIQLRYVQPAVSRGELDGMELWTQYNRTACSSPWKRLVIC